MKGYLRLIVFTSLAGGLLLSLTTRSQMSVQGVAAQVVIRTNIDVGRVKLAGETVRTGGRRDLRGNGFGVMGTEDSMQYDYRPLLGDGQIIAKVVLSEPTNGMAKAGIMLRESTAPDAACVAISVTPTNGLAFQWRERAGEPALTEIFHPGRLAGTNLFFRLGASRSWEVGNTNFVPRFPQTLQMAGRAHWLKLERRDAVIAAYFSPNGSNWTWVASREVPMTKRVFAGLAVSSQNFNKLASARSGVFRIESLPQAATASVLAGNGEGLRAFYFPTASTNRFIRVSPALDMRWGQKPQLPQLKHGQFSARWIGDMEAQHDEIYNFHLMSRGAVRLWLDGRKLIDHWHAPPAAELRGAMRLEAGRRYRLKVEYLDNGDRSECRLMWSSPSTPRQMIPRGQLYLPNQPQGQATPEAASLGVDESSPLHPFSISADVGVSRVPGQAAVTSAGYMVDGGGLDIGGNADAFHFVYKPWSGDGEIVAKVDGSTSGSHGSKAGIMIRQSLAPDAAQVSLTLGHVKGLLMEERRKASEGTQLIEKFPPEDQWLKLVRRRAVFTAFSSKDGTNWTWIGKTEVLMSTNVFVGLAVSSRRVGETYRAHFSGLSLQRPSAGSGRKISGTGDGLSAQYFDQATSNVVERVDPSLNFAWGRHWPAEGIGRGNFSVRWRGLLEAQMSEPYDLRFISDGGVRVWLDGRMILDDWAEHTKREKKVRVDLKAGHRYALQVEYHAKLNGLVRMLWSGPGTPINPVPQSQFYSSEHPAFAEIPDKDHDGMPDAWEQAYRFNELDASDAGQDADNDGLTNLAEYQGGTNPRRKDTDGDGLSDGWEINHRMNPLIAAPSGHDTDGDGLSDREEMELGTDPNSEDSDGDGLSDYTEARETETDPLSSMGEVQVVTHVPGSSATGHLGRWTRSGLSIVAEDGRGQIDLAFNVPAADMFRIELKGGSANPRDSRRDFELQLWIDGQYLGRRVLKVGGENHGLLGFLTPYLRSGEHKLTLFWDNAHRDRKLRVDLLRVQRISGPDADASGISDWVESRLRNASSADTRNSFSFVSPAFIEGSGAYVQLMDISGGTQPKAGVSGQWYADVPLSASNRTRIVCSFQNEGLKITNHVTWRPTNLLLAENAQVRVGDSLLLVAHPPGVTAGNMEISVEGITNYQGVVGDRMAHQFTTAGEFTVTGRYESPEGHTTNRTVSVSVVAPPLGPAFAAWAGKLRPWQFPSGHVLDLQSGPDVELLSSPSPGAQTQRFEVNVDRADPMYIVARMPGTEAILDRVRVDGFRLFSGYETGLSVVDTFEDGSELVELKLVMSPVRARIRVKVEVHAGGILLDDGTTSRILEPSDFDSLGRASVRFVRAAFFKTSICHRIKVIQDGVLIGTYP